MIFLLVFQIISKYHFFFLASLPWKSLCMVWLRTPYLCSRMTSLLDALSSMYLKGKFLPSLIQYSRDHGGSWWSWSAPLIWRTPDAPLNIYYTHSLSYAFVPCLWTQRIFHTHSRTWCSGMPFGIWWFYLMYKYFRLRRICMHPHYSK